MKDPAFLFYPGDYLRDTQCLSEKAQVAYDRIMCEHMRNICISQQQLNFFTKRLSEEEKEELKMILKEIKGGYQIEWVAEGIDKRRAYSESRRKNRTSNKENISKTYDSHMENEIENINVIKAESKDEEKIVNTDFENFWVKYGRIGNKQKALSMYEKAIKEVSPEYLDEKLNTYLKFLGATNVFTKHASTWLNPKYKEFDNEYNAETFNNKYKEKSIDQQTEEYEKERPEINN